LTDKQRLSRGDGKLLPRHEQRKPLERPEKESA